MSSVIKCKKCGGYIVLSFNSIFPPVVSGNACECKNFPLSENIKNIKKEEA